MAVAEMLLESGPIVLNSEQKEAARAGINDVGILSGRDVDWWTHVLQL